MHGSVGNYTCNMYMGIYSKFTNNLLVIASIWQDNVDGYVLQFSDINQ